MSYPTGLKFILLFFLLAQATYAKRPVKSILVIGWDGADRRVLMQMVRTGLMPTFKKFIENGSFSRLAIEEGRTETKPGWAQIWSGYDTRYLKVLNNKAYQPMPKGATVYERAHDHFKDKGGLYTLFLTGKLHNTGALGPHKICINCLTRIPGTKAKSGWNENNPNAPLIPGAKKRLVATRTGEPFYHAAKIMNYYEPRVGYGHKLGRVRGSWLTFKKYLPELKKAKRFLAFLHWSDPDEFGHEKNFKSEEYRKSLRDLDKHLDKLLKYFKRNNMDPYILITTDHGFNGFGHKDAPLVWMAANVKGMRDMGDRRDFAPTLYDLFGMDYKKMQPKLNGESMFETVPVIREHQSRR